MHANGIPVLPFWVDHICAAPARDRLVYLQMLRGSLDASLFDDIRQQCEQRLQTRLSLSRLERLGIPAPIAELLRTVDRRLMRRRG